MTSASSLGKVQSCELCLLLSPICGLGGVEGGLGFGRPKVTAYGVVLHLLCLGKELGGFRPFPKGFRPFPRGFFPALR